MWLKKFIVILTLATFVPSAWAIKIPVGLSAEDRKEVIRTLGLNSAIKMLNNPYPLGGYSGFEVGYSVEFVNIRDMRRLGTPGGKLSDQTEWRYSRLTFGKGLYNDVDFFLSFMPPAGDVGATDFGGAARWSFYQAQFLPINISALLHFNQLNYSNTFTNRNYGAELMVGVNVDNFALYFGGGSVTAEGTFIGPTAGVCNEDCTVTDPAAVNQISRTVSHTVHETHTVVGISIHYENLFAAAEVDRYRDAVYSMKLGLRF